MVINYQTEGINMNLDKIYRKIFKSTKVYESYFASKNIDIKSKKLVVFGTGNFSRIISCTIPYKIEYYLDNNKEKWGSTFFGKSVKNPETLKDENKEEIFVLVASDFFFEISQQLEEEYKLSDQEHFDWAREIFEEVEDYYYLTKLLMLAVLFGLPAFLFLRCLKRKIIG